MYVWIWPFWTVGNWTWQSVFLSWPCSCGWQLLCSVGPCWTNTAEQGPSGTICDSSFSGSEMWWEATSFGRFVHEVAFRWSIVQSGQLLQTSLIIFICTHRCNLNISSVDFPYEHMERVTHVSCSLTASTADINKPLSNLRRLIVAEWQALKFRIV